MYIRVVSVSESMPLRGLRDQLNRCILRAMWKELLEDPWYSDGNPPVLKVQRVCDCVGSSVFVVSLWVGGSEERILSEQIRLLNNVKVRIDQFIEISGAYYERVPSDVVDLWERVSSDWSVDNGDVKQLMTKYCFLEKILHLQDPEKFRAVLGLCDPCLHWGVCKLYSDELDSAVEFLSRQIDQLSSDAMALMD